MSLGLRPPKVSFTYNDLVVYFSELIFLHFSLEDLTASGYLST